MPFSCFCRQRFQPLWSWIFVTKQKIQGSLKGSSSKNENSHTLKKDLLLLLMGSKTALQKKGRYTAHKGE